MTREDARDARGRKPMGGKGGKGASDGKGPRESRADRGRAQERVSHVPERARAAPPDDGRPARVAARVRAELSEILLRGEIRDPAAAGAIVSSVEVTRDLSLVKIGVRALDPDTSLLQRDRMVKAFQRASGFLRTQVGRALAIRQSPELRFSWDVGIDHAARVEALLRDEEPETEVAPLSPAPVFVKKTASKKAGRRTGGRS